MTLCKTTDAGALPRTPTAVRDGGGGEEEAVLERHRDEWRRHRRLVDAVMESVDYDQARVVKLLAETLRLRQEGERRAWGLDNRTDAGNAGTLEVRWKAQA